MDRLPSAMAASLSGIIRYNAPVVRVERQSTGFRMPVLASAENGLHSAGEHTSIWTGWMEGALESGERTAREVLNATGRPWPEQTGPTR
jgi:monoamine oxidase